MAANKRKRHKKGRGLNHGGAESAEKSRERLTGNPLQRSSRTG